MSREELDRWYTKSFADMTAQEEEDWYGIMAYGEKEYLDKKRKKTQKYHHDKAIYIAKHILPNLNYPFNGK